MGNLVYMLMHCMLSVDHWTTDTADVQCSGAWCGWAELATNPNIVKHDNDDSTDNDAAAL